MTQAFNLSQLANNLNSSGQLDATDGLVNAVPVANGGTGSSTDSGARTNLNVPTRTGGDASGTWGINISGNAATATNATFATTAGNGGVTSVNGSTGAVTVSTTPTTDQVLNATAGAAIGAVGTYAVLYNNSGTDIAINATIAGSSLGLFAGNGAQNTFDTIVSQNYPFGVARTGTWRALAFCYRSNSFQCCGAIIYQLRPSLFLRIS